MNVVATQSSSSAPVEISWSPLTDGANIITGYRIYYGNGESILLPSVATSLGLILDGDQIGQQLSIRSERGQMFSELINVTVTCKSQVRSNSLSSLRNFHWFISSWVSNSVMPSWCWEEYIYCPGSCYSICGTHRNSCCSSGISASKVCTTSILLFMIHAKSW